MSERIDIINYLKRTFKAVVSETHYLKNKSKKVNYPYQTFSLTGEPTRTNGKGFYIDVSIFDDGKNSDVDIEKALSSMIEAFEDYHDLTDSFLIQIDYRNDNAIPTGSDSLLRRELQLYVKIDWRK